MVSAVNKLSSVNHFKVDKVAKAARIDFQNLSEPEIGKEIIANIRNMSVLEDATKGKAPAYLEFISKGIKKIIPYVERKFISTTNPKRKSVEDMVNYGNVAKEFACMVVYPAQVLTNPDIPKEKRRFVGMYDFFVTCFSLGGTLWAARYGKKLLNGRAKAMMSRYSADELIKLGQGKLAKHLGPAKLKEFANIDNHSEVLSLIKAGKLKEAEEFKEAKKLEMLGKLYPNVERAIEGGGFVMNIAITTILFKRIFAPALSPPLAAGARKKMEANDLRKEQAKAQMAAGNASKPVEAKPATEVKATEVNKAAEVKPEEKTKPAVEAKADDKAELIAANSAKPANIKSFAKVG